MPVTRYPDYRKYVSLINRMPSEVAELQETLIARIQTRTGEGVDYNGVPFKKYSDSYLKRRLANGRNKAVNLQWHNQMLRAITAKNIKGGFRIYFMNSTENKKAKYNQETRKFFGLDKKQKEEVLKHLKNKINKL